MLRLGGAEVQIAYLELVDNHIGALGGFALGKALSRGNNLSLLTLQLNFNTSLGDEGVINLCQGLRTNGTLKQLHLEFCSITAEGAPAIAEVLANCYSSLEVLDGFHTLISLLYLDSNCCVMKVLRLNGNCLRGEGLLALSKGLLHNCRLQRLSLADNKIEYVRHLFISA